MFITTLTSQDFDQAPDRAKWAAADGPVFITDGSETTHVLLSAEDYRRLSGERRSIVEALSMPGLSEIEIEFSRPKQLRRSADFS